MNVRSQWKNHPLYSAGKIELVPTAWVYKYQGSDVSPSADLMDGTIVTPNELWKNILQEGLYDPLIIRVGLKNKKMRLEAGNHRVQLFHRYGVEEVPVTIQLREACGPHLGDVMTNGTHNFDIDEKLKITDITEEYMRPSEVFRGLAV